MLLPSLCQARNPLPEKSRFQLPTEELKALDAAIKSSATYAADKHRHIDSIAARIPEMRDSAALCNLYISLSDLYRPVDTDSAIKYAQRALLLNSLPAHSMIRSRLAMVKALSTAGIFTAALSDFERIGNEGVPSDLRVDYWWAGRLLFGYMRSYVADHTVFYNIYDRRYQQYDDSLIAHLPPNTVSRQFIESERLVADGKGREAALRLNALMKRLTPSDNFYAMAAFQMAEVYRMQGDETQYAAFLAKAATADVKCCVREGLALPRLAEWLYEQGELDDAFGYINYALGDAASGNARMRTASIAHLVPMIDEAYRNQINSSRDELMLYFLLVTFLFIVSVTLLVVLLRQIRRSRENARRLQSTSRLQQTYIGNFIGLYSTYADRLNRLTTLVSRKLASGQADDLLKMINSGRLTAPGDDDFVKIFDNAFLDLYPDFIPGVNSLLRPEEAIRTKEPRTLTPELRIYAFVRLGMDESTRIAQILHYSVSTIYAYRNRMRNKAVSRDTFDADIMKIGVDHPVNPH